MSSSPLKNNSTEVESSEKYYLSIVLPIIALLSALFLLPLEKLFPYPYIFEEIIKAFLVFLILSISGKFFQIKLAFFIGFFFALSENIFYLTSPVLYQSPVLFLQRIALVSFFHIFTLLIILFCGQKKRWLIIPALIFAMFIHYFYNQNISAYFNLLI
jgi:hypothetical protein